MIFFADVFLPEHRASVDVEAMGPTVGADGVDAVVFDDGRRSRAGAAFGNEGPIAVGLIVNETPENFAGLRVEAMDAFFGGFDEIDVEDERFAKGDDGAGEAARFFGSREF